MGEGILKLEEDCKVDTGSRIITAERSLNSSFEIISQLGEFELQPINVNNQSIVPSLGTFRKTEFKALEAEVVELRNSGLYKLNVHDIHHYSVTYALIAAIGVLYFIRKRKINKTQTPIPAPRNGMRRKISMPNLGEAENVQGSLTT